MRTKQVTLTTSFPAADDTRMKLYSLSNVTGVPVSKLTRMFINSGLKEYVQHLNFNKYAKTQHLA